MNSLRRFGGTMHDPYVAVDSILMPWAQAHGFPLTTRYRDDIVRSIWFCDEHGNQRAQMWLGISKPLNTVSVFVGEFKPDLPGKWGERLHREAAISELGDTLNEFSKAALRWAGPGAFT